MKIKWLSAILNFLFMGVGYLYNGKRIVLGILLTIGAIAFTYLEQIHVFPNGDKLQALDSKAFLIMFVSVFIVNIGLAIDAYREAAEINN